MGRGFHDHDEDRRHAQSLNEWVKKVEVDSGTRAGLTTEVAEKLNALERENRDLRQANEILRKASAYFAMAELEPSVKDMIAFIDGHRKVYGVEPICRVLPIAPSTYHATSPSAPIGRSCRQGQCET